MKVGKLKGSAQIIINDESVSRIHAKIRRENGKVFIQDLNSTNGTMVNGKKLSPGDETEVHREDKIQFGKILVNVV